LRLFQGEAAFGLAPRSSKPFVLLWPRENAARPGNAAGPESGSCATFSLPNRWSTSLICQGDQHSGGDQLV